MSELKDPFGWVGQTIDDAFIVEEVVGEGGFAVVYRGHHKGFDEKVAVKALKFPTKLGEAERDRFLESFKSEGKLLRKLSSANAGIVQALDVGASTSPSGTWTPYLILEWLRGETLETDLKKRAASGAGGRSLADALVLLDAAARALDTAHGMGIAHRDVKPSNLFLVEGAKDDNPTMKVVDFGIAKVMTDSEDVMRAHEATGESIHAFSPKYGAPEQFDRKLGATGPWTDVYALALVLVEVVAGKTAMKGDTAQLFVIASNREERPTLKSVGVDEGDAVEKVLSRALAVDTRERFARAGEFWDALRHAVEHGETVLSEHGKSAETRREGMSGPTEPKPNGDTKPSATKALEPPPASRLPQIAVAAVMVGGGAALAYWVLPHKGVFADAPAPVTSTVTHLADFSRDAEAPAVNLASAAVAAPPGYQRYENGKYHFVVDLPSDFTHYEESNTGEGRTYSTTTGAVLSVAGGELVGSIETMYKSEFMGDETRSLERWFLPDQSHTADMYVLTGYERDTEPFIIKVIVTGGIYARLYMTYPRKEQPHYDPLIPHMRDSFSFTAVSSTVPQPLPEVDAGGQLPLEPVLPPGVGKLIVEGNLLDAGRRRTPDGGWR